MIKLVIVDFDDTLCLTEEAAFVLENAVAKEMGFSAMSRKVHKETWGKPLQEIISTRIPGIDPYKFMQLIDKRMPEYAREGKLDSISKENLRTLHQLKKLDKQLAILTSRSLIEVKHLLHETHPLVNLLDAFYHRDNSDFLKPDPRVFDRVLKDFSEKPKNCVYIGDSVSDAIAAKGAGMHFVAVFESKLRTKEDFKEHAVDFFVDKFTDILPYILQQ